MEIFYDSPNHMTISKGKDMVNIDRIYLLDFSQFSKYHWDELLRIYKTLPLWMESDVAAWYGDDEDLFPHLFASVEPTGLQVYGVLQTDLWESWHKNFLNEVKDMPASASIE